MSVRYQCVWHYANTFSVKEAMKQFEGWEWGIEKCVDQTNTKLLQTLHFSLLLLSGGGEGGLVLSTFPLL